MCEIFGARGQDLTYPEMKWWADRMQVCGFNVMIPHSFKPRAPHDTDCPPYFYNGGFEPRSRSNRFWPTIQPLSVDAFRRAACLPRAVLFSGHARQVGALHHAGGFHVTLQDRSTTATGCPSSALRTVSRKSRATNCACTANATARWWCRRPRASRSRRLRRRGPSSKPAHGSRLWPPAGASLTLVRRRRTLHAAEASWAWTRRSASRRAATSAKAAGAFFWPTAEPGRAGSGRWRGRRAACAARTFRRDRRWYNALRRVDREGPRCTFNANQTPTTRRAPHFPRA